MLVHCTLYTTISTHIWAVLHITVSLGLGLFFLCSYVFFLTSARFFCVMVSFFLYFRRILCFFKFFLSFALVRLLTLVAEMTHYVSNGTLTFQSAEAITCTCIVPHRMIWSWYTGRWRGGLLHLVQGGGDSPPRLLLAVPNVTAHQSTASVPITVLAYKRFSYWFLHGPYNSAALMRCLWWSVAVRLN